MTAWTISLFADSYGVNESRWHDWCRTSITCVDEAQTLVRDKEALEGHRSTCMMFVFSQALKHTSVAKHCEVFAVCGCQYVALPLSFIDASFYVCYIADMWYIKNRRLERCQEHDSTVHCGLDFTVKYPPDNLLWNQSFTVLICRKIQS